MSIAAKVDAGKALEAAGDDEGALATFLSVLHERPRNLPALMSAGRVKQRQKKLDEALAFYGKAAEFHPAFPGPVLAMCAITINTDEAEARRLVELGLKEFPDAPQFRNFQKLIEIRDVDDEPLTGFDLRQELLNPDIKGHVHLEALQRQRAILSNDDYAELSGLIADRFPGRISQSRYMRSLVETGAYDKALTVFGTLDGNSAPELVRDAALCFAALGRKEDAKAALQRFIGDGADPHQILRASIDFLDVASNTAEATDIVEDLNARHAEPGLEHLLEFAASIRPPQRALIGSDFQNRGFSWSSSENANRAILVFAGFGFRTGAIPFSLLDRFFAGHNIAIGSVVDRNGCICWRGVRNLGTGFEKATDNLGAILSGHGIGAVYTLGNSAGGTAAMTYGCQLGARHALSFAGPSDLRETFLDNAQDLRSRHMIRRLNRRLGDRELNVRAWLEAAPHRCPITAYYCEQEAGDRIQALNIGHLDEVRLMPVARYKAHECIGSALGTGQLATALNAIVEDATGL